MRARFPVVIHRTLRKAAGRPAACTRFLPENYGKEFIRIAYAEKGYRGDGDAPSMPEELWASASERYISIYELLTGKTFEAGSYPADQRLIKNLKDAGVIS